MLSRLGWVFIVALPLTLTGMLGGAEPAACIGLECLQQDDWVCCMPSPDECDSWKLNYCNTESSSNPFDVQCGYGQE